jgi:hypothetical protein
MPERIGIPKVEYEERRHAFELCRWINAKLQQLQDGGSFDEQYFERIGLNVKKLVEEAIPLSRLGLYLSTPASEVYITCFADNRNHDALVEITGFNSRTFRVEVTTTETDDSTLRRQAISRDGYVGLAGPIRRNGRTISWAPEMVASDEEDNRCIALMLKRLQEKADSGRYDEDTAVLVYLTEFRSIDLYYRAELVRRTKEYLLQQRPSIRHVYYCYVADYSIDSIPIGRL